MTSTRNTSFITSTDLKEYHVSRGWRWWWYQQPRRIHHHQQQEEDEREFVIVKHFHLRDPRRYQVGKISTSSSPISLHGFCFSTIPLTMLLLLFLMCPPSFLSNNPLSTTPTTTRITTSSTTTLAYASSSPLTSSSTDSLNGIALNDGPGNLAQGHRLFAQQSYDAASLHYWRAVLFHAESSKGQYTVDEAFGSFLRCYAVQNRLADGFVFVARESIVRGQLEMAKVHIVRALEVDPNHEEGLILKQSLLGADADDYDDNVKDTVHSADDNEHNDGNDDDDDVDDDEYQNKSPEELYQIGANYFADKQYEDCAHAFDLSCKKSNGRLGPSCANAVYCRVYVLDWGFNGTQFERDMKLIESLTTLETAQYRSEQVVTSSSSSKEKKKFGWKRATSTHPHMMLGYPVNSTLKRYVAESVAFMDELMARVDPSSGQIKGLPSDLPYDQSDYRAKFVFEAADKSNFKLRIGFVGSGFNSKAVLYLSHDMFRFFDRSKLEIHIFSCGPADNPLFIKFSMRGVDWRERVKQNVDHFHDVQSIRGDHIQLARFIHEKNIHILIEWDGYARQGERAQGLFALRPAPVQILHQEYLGTSGAQYVDYLITDRITSPEKLDYLYTEKFIYMPNHFFSKGHAMQVEVKPPTYGYKPAQDPYVLGTGSPVENRCLSPRNVGPDQPSIVYCNFNKFLKNNPQTVRSWIRILREVPDSILCLLENPVDGVPYMRKFVHEAAGTSANHSDPETFVEGDGNDLNDRIHFLPWQANPFDHQMRNHDFCDVMLDSHPYNGHTVAQDALYGGVPIVTRSDGDDMSSRVTTSANVVLGLEELNAYGGPTDYENIAIKLGKDRAYRNKMRKKLIGTCLQKNPMHPYWDVPRYVRNFESGLWSAWEQYLSGKLPKHIEITENDETKRGTYEEDLDRRSRQQVDNSRKMGDGPKGEL